MIKREKFSIIKYHFYLLYLSILFTCVTFSRFTGATSGNTEVLLSSFACSYTIEDMSAATFSNADYWLNDETTAMNTARSVRFTIRNYTVSEDGNPDVICGVDMQSTIRLYAPAEFAVNLAIQIAEADKDGTYITKTPQYVLKDLIYDGDAFRTSGKFSTEESIDYDARGDLSGNQIDEVLQISGNFSGTEDCHNGTLSAYCTETGNRISITANMTEAEYCVGFYRQDAENANQTATSLYLDCTKQVPFYTIDFSLPFMLLEGNTEASHTYVLFLTLISKTENEDFNSVWNEEYNHLLEEPDKGEIVTFNGATVTGYHFDSKADLYELSDGEMAATGLETTIRIQKKYDYENGGATLSYFHVAPLSEGAASVVHNIEDFYDKSGASVTVYDFSGIKTVQNLWGTCCNDGKSGYICFANVPDNPFYCSYESQVSGGDYDYEIKDALSKGYSTKLNVLFVQASDNS